jgi:hypothetical protein
MQERQVAHFIIAAVAATSLACSTNPAPQGIGAPFDVASQSTAEFRAGAFYFVDDRTASRAEVENLHWSSIVSIEVLKSDAAIRRYGSESVHGVIAVSTTGGASPVDVSAPSRLPATALYFIDGHTASREDVHALNHDQIDSIEVIRGTPAVELFGPLGFDGVIRVRKKASL